MSCQQLKWTTYCSPDNKVEEKVIHQDQEPIKSAETKSQSPKRMVCYSGVLVTRCEETAREPRAGEFVLQEESYWQRFQNLIAGE